jgi:hypothetical protein
LDEQFVSANDKGYIPAMEKLGAELGLSAEDLQEIISNIRMRDREMQGVTPEQEAQAQEAVKNQEKLQKKENIFNWIYHIQKHQLLQIDYMENMIIY